MSIADIAAAVDIANLALQRLGEPVITTMTENSRNANICNQLYAQNRDYCMMLSEWDCLMQRSVLTRSGKIAITAVTAADPAVVTISGHVYLNNELVHIESITGMTQLNDNTYRVFSSTSGTITLYDTDGTTTNASAFSAWVSGGYVYRDAGTEFAYVYDLPTDCIRVVGMLDSGFGESDDYNFRKERTFIYSDLENAGVKYIRQNTDATLYEADLVEVMAARLAWLISLRIHGDIPLKTAVAAEAERAIAKAKMTNALGREDEGPPEALWTEAQG